jgi:uncharacterized protein
MQEKKDNIINYEEIFKHKQENLDFIKKRDQGFINILIYFFLFIIGFASLIPMLFIKRDNPNKVVLDSMKNYSDAVAIIDTSYYENNSGDFNNLFTVDFNNSFILVSNTNNTLYQNYLSETLTFEDITAQNIGVVTLEDDKKIEFNLFYSSSSSISSALDIRDSKYQKITSAYTYNKNALLMFSTYLIVALVLMAFNHKVVIKDFNLLLADKEEPIFTKSIKGFAAMLVATFLINIPVTLISQLLNFKSTSDNQTQIINMLNSSAGIFLILSTVILAPIVEELVFRYSIFNLFKNKKIAIVVSAIFFGSIHLTSEMVLLFMNGFEMMKFLEVIILSIPYIGIGAFLAYYYHKTKENITLLIILHALSNLFAVLAAFL